MLTLRVDTFGSPWWPIVSLAAAALQKEKSTQRKALEKKMIEFILVFVNLSF